MGGIAVSPSGLFRTGLAGVAPRARGALRRADVVLFIGRLPFYPLILRSSGKVHSMRFAANVQPLPVDPRPSGSDGESRRILMTIDARRRTLLAAGASALALGALPNAHAQAKTKLRFSSAFTEQDLRAEAYRNFATAIKDGYEFEPYWG